MKAKLNRSRGVLALLLGTCLAGAVSAQDLESGFRDPPNSARPRVWWHWMDGNITPEGIDKDLAWLDRIGIGGVDAIDIAMATPQVVRDRIIYRTPAWDRIFRHAVERARALGLEFGINTSPGWSLTGGPWVTPEMAMKKLVWSVTDLPGGQRRGTALPSPPQNSGPFQDVKPASFLFLSEIHAEHYRDVAVLAYRIPAGGLTRSPAYRSNSGAIDAALLQDGALGASLPLKKETDGTAWVELDYGAAQTIRSARLGTSAPAALWVQPSPMTAALEVERDGSWSPVAKLAITTAAQTTVTFPAVTGKRFRFRFEAAQQYPSRPLPGWPSAPGADTSQLAQMFAAPGLNIQLSELSLSPEARVNEPERKAGYAVVDDYYALHGPAADDGQAVALKDIVDLTAKLRPDGTLDWVPPAGRWRVVRFGYTLTGKTNGPAPKESTGLEVDKLSRPAMRAYLDAYLSGYEKLFPDGKLGAAGLNALVMDSAEIGPQNWTQDMPAAFARLRGYPLTPWLLTLTGTRIASAAESDRFLYDFRRTISDLLAGTNQEVAEAARKRGLLHYAESLEYNRPQIGDDMAMRSFADAPMGAMWVHDPAAGPQSTYIGDLKGAASVAHLYGKPFVAAESFDSVFAPYAFAPNQLKPIADLEFALGVNRIVIHSSVHQPNDTAPGLGLAIFGQNFNRHDSWADQAGSWIRYLSRVSFLLQQGEPVVDIAYFHGEEAPLTVLGETGRLADLSQRYASDFVNLDALTHQLRVKDGAIISGSGMSYRVLQLGGTSAFMTVPALRAIHALVEAGATVLGKAPVTSPSLSDNPTEFARLRADLWEQGGAGKAFGRGRVISKGGIDALLESMGVAPDVELPVTAPAILHAHRRAGNADIYFVTNRSNAPQRLELGFRVSGRAPERWDADTGARTRLSYRRDGATTRVPVELDALGSAFIVFNTPSDRNERNITPAASRMLRQLDGPWQVTFQPGRGAPQGKLSLAAGSWATSSDPALRYFSGTASYARSLEVEAGDRAKGDRVELDLGDVREVAEVKVNGCALGTLWHAPYRIDITDALRPGANQLEVAVTNLWVNRLIGDQQPGAVKLAPISGPSYHANAPLRASGLLGPVSVNLVRPAAEE